MKPKNNMPTEQLRKFDNNQDGQKLLTSLINRTLFTEYGQPLTLKQSIQQDAIALAQKTITELNSNLSTLPENIIKKITPRSVSWNYQNIATRYQNSDSMETLLTRSSDETKKTNESIEPSEEIVARQWWANTIRYETRAAIKRQQSATEKKLAYQQEITIVKTKQLQKELDVKYGDSYNRLICQQADTTNSTDLITAKQQVNSNISNQITDSEIINMLATREYSRQVQNLSQLLKTSLPRLDNNPEKAINFAALRYELDRRKTDIVWEQRTKLQDIIFSRLNGNPIELVTMLCTINEFDYRGGYNLNPDLNAYQNNSKVEPVPLIIDEMASIVRLFKFYGINCSLNMFVADTDYTEIGANGPVIEVNLANLQKYMANLRNYITKFNGVVSVNAISSITDDNALYQTVKTRVLDWVTKRKDYDFNRNWGQKLEDDVERRSETFSKKKLCPPEIMRQESLRVSQNIWAVNAAQGAVFSNLGPNTILLSTERRNRDANYVVDKQSTSNFPPVLYVLSAAENWNRKIVDKTIFEAD